MLFFVPLALVRIGLRSRFSGEGDRTWADLAEYALLFLIGYLIAGDQRFTKAFKRHSWLFLALGIVAWGGELYFIGELDYPYLGRELFSWDYVLFNVVLSIARWSWVAFFMSLGARYLNADHRLRTYGNDVVMPFYLLHQTVILLVGRTVIPLDMSIPIKYLIISTSSFVLIMAIYELLIRRFNPIRILFGMRLRPSG